MATLFRYIAGLFIIVMLALSEHSVANWKIIHIGAQIRILRLLWIFPHDLINLMFGLFLKQAFIFHFTYFLTMANNPSKVVWSQSFLQKKKKNQKFLVTGNHFSFHDPSQIACQVVIFVKFIRRYSRRH